MSEEATKAAAPPDANHSKAVDREEAHKKREALLNEIADRVKLANPDVFELILAHNLMLTQFDRAISVIAGRLSTLEVVVTQHVRPTGPKATPDQAAAGEPLDPAKVEEARSRVADAEYHHAIDGAIPAAADAMQQTTGQPPATDTSN